jgi:hypothetical protein
MKVDLVLKLQVAEILTFVQKIAPDKSVELHISSYSAIQCFLVQSIGEACHQMWLK